MEIGSKARHSFTDMLRGWIILSRPPFHTVGVLPFILGTLIAWRLDSAFRINVFLVGVAAIVLIMLSTYYAGEYYDLRGDMLSAKMERNTFSGGSQAIVKGMVRPVHAWKARGLQMVLGSQWQKRFFTAVQQEGALYMSRQTVTCGHVHL